MHNLKRCRFILLSLCCSLHHAMDTDHDSKNSQSKSWHRIKVSKGIWWIKASCSLVRQLKLIHSALETD